MSWLSVDDLAGLTASVLTIALVAAVVVFAFALIKRRERAYLEPFFWLHGMLILYFGVPACLSDDINVFLNWNISRHDIDIAKLVVSALLFASCVGLSSLSVRDIQVETARKRDPVIEGIWMVLTFYLCALFLYRVCTGTLLLDRDYLDVSNAEPTANMRLKNIAYLLVCVSILRYSATRTLTSFLPNLLVTVLELCQGGRTLAAIGLVPTFLSLAIYYRRMFVVPILLIAALMGVVGVVRSSFTAKDLPLTLEAIGEFRETYITFPLLVSNHDYVGQGSMNTLISVAVMMVSGPVRPYIIGSQNILPPGNFASSRIIGRGYGLGSNFITEAMFYGYFAVPISCVLLILHCVIALIITRRVNLRDSLVFMSFFAICLRLTVREGVFGYLFFLWFLLAVYAVPVYVIRALFYSLAGRKAGAARKGWAS